MTDDVANLRNSIRPRVMREASIRSSTKRTRRQRAVGVEHHDYVGPGFLACLRDAVRIAFDLLQSTGKTGWDGQAV